MHLMMYLHNLFNVSSKGWRPLWENGRGNGQEGGRPSQEDLGQSRALGCLQEGFSFSYYWKDMYTYSVQVFF